jgi:hypothetical protein
MLYDARLDGGKIKDLTDLGCHDGRIIEASPTAVAVHRAVPDDLVGIFPHLQRRAGIAGLLARPALGGIPLGQFLGRLPSPTPALGARQTLFVLGCPLGDGVRGGRLARVARVARRLVFQLGDAGPQLAVFFLERRQLSPQRLDLRLQLGDDFALRLGGSVIIRVSVTIGHSGQNDRPRAKSGG